jgi:hypothetical protein
VERHRFDDKCEQLFLCSRAQREQRRRGSDLIRLRSNGAAVSRSPVIVPDFANDRCAPIGARLSVFHIKQHWRRLALARGDAQACGNTTLICPNPNTTQYMGRVRQRRPSATPAPPTRRSLRLWRLTIKRPHCITKLRKFSRSRHAKADGVHAREGVYSCTQAAPCFGWIKTNFARVKLSRMARRHNPLRASPRSNARLFGISAPMMKRGTERDNT